MRIVKSLSAMTQMRRGTAVVAAAVLTTGLALMSNAQAQVAGAPQAIGSGVERVGGFKPLSAPTSGPAASGSQQANPVQAQPQQPQQPQLQLQPGRPMAGTPAPMPYPRGPSMPSPEINLVNEAIDQYAPMTAEEELRFRRELYRRREVAAENVTGRPVPEVTTQVFQVDLSPVAKASLPVVRIEVNQGAIVSFLDAAGKPWPARVADNFNPTALTVSQFTEHQLSISAKTSRPINSLVPVALEGLPTAIILKVISGQAQVDAQVLMMIPKYKDGAPMDVGAINGQPTLNSTELIGYLQKIPGATAKALKVEGIPGVMAWQTSASRMVVRSTSKVASGFFRSAGMGDGTEVFELPLSPVVSFYYGDSTVRATVSGFQVGGFGGEK